MIRDNKLIPKCNPCNQLTIELSYLLEHMAITYVFFIYYIHLLFKLTNQVRTGFLI